MMSTEVGFIGLGAMGEPMAANLAAAGYKLRVYNRTASKADALVAAGATRVERPGDAAIAGGVVITMVADDAALEQRHARRRRPRRTSGARRNPYLDEHGGSGDHAPLAEHHAACGNTIIASPVFGRPDAAKAKRLWVLAAGPAVAKTAIRPLLEAMGQAIFDFGEEPGAANVAKLVGNFLIAANLEAMSEAFAMAEKQGVERAAVADMLAKTLFACPIYQGYGKAIAEKRFTPVGFRLVLGSRTWNWRCAPRRR